MLQKITSFELLRDFKGKTIFDYCGASRQAYQVIDFRGNNIEIIGHEESNLRLLPIQNILAGNWFVDVEEYFFS